MLPSRLKSPATIATGRSLMLKPSLVEVVRAELRAGEAAVTVGDQDGEAVRPLIDDHEIVAAVAR